MFGPKMEDIIEGWRKLHNEELHKFSSSPNVLRVIKSNLVHMEKLEGRNQLGDEGVDGRIILKCILKK
jgi:hypothetical protein